MARKTVLATLREELEDSHAYAVILEEEEVELRSHLADLQLALRIIERALNSRAK